MRTTPKVRRATGIVFATVVATSLAACGGGSPGSSSSGSASTAVTRDRLLGPLPPVRRQLGLGQVRPGLRTQRGHDQADHGTKHRPHQQPHHRGPRGQRARRGVPRQPGRAGGLRLRPAGTARRPSASTRGGRGRQPRRPRHRRRQDLRRPDRRQHPRALLQRGRPREGRRRPGDDHRLGQPNAALEKVTRAGSKGITFAGVPGEEGTFQFLPWFWGAGADLKDIGSDAGRRRPGSCVSDWVAKGYAPKSAITDNQSASWDQFLTGDYAFAENGSWFAKAAAAEKFPIKMMPIPSASGGAAPVPTGGEFGVVPVHKDNSAGHYAAAKEVIDCLLGSDKQITTDNMLGYFTANKATRQRADRGGAGVRAVDRCDQRCPGAHDRPRDRTT